MLRQPRPPRPSAELRSTDMKARPENLDGDQQHDPCAGGSQASGSEEAMSLGGSVGDEQELLEEPPDTAQVAAEPAPAEPKARRQRHTSRQRAANTPRTSVHNPSTVWVGVVPVVLREDRDVPWLPELRCQV